MKPVIFGGYEVATTPLRMNGGLHKNHFSYFLHSFRFYILSCAWRFDTFIFHTVTRSRTDLVVEVLRQEEVGGQVLVLLAGEVGLHHQVLGEAQRLQLEEEGRGGVRCMKQEWNHVT